VPLYSRIKPDIESDVEQQNNRGRIYQHIKENPGTTLTKTMRAVETGNGTTVYHLGRLDVNGFIVRKGKRYFVRGAVPQFYNGMKKPLKEREEALVKYLRCNRRASENVLAEGLKTRRSTLHRHLKNLMGLEIVAREKIDGIYSYSLTERYDEWVRRHVESPLKPGEAETPMKSADLQRAIRPAGAEAPGGAVTGSSDRAGNTAGNICPHCGETMPLKGAAYCLYCGKKLG